MLVLVSAENGLELGFIVFQWGFQGKPAPVIGVLLRFWSFRFAVLLVSGVISGVISGIAFLMFFSLLKTLVKNASKSSPAKRYINIKTPLFVWGGCLYYRFSTLAEHPSPGFRRVRQGQTLIEYLEQKQYVAEKLGRRFLFWWFLQKYIFPVFLLSDPGEGGFAGFARVKLGF